MYMSCDVMKTWFGDGFNIKQSFQIYYFLNFYFGIHIQTQEDWLGLMGTVQGKKGVEIDTQMSHTCAVHKIKNKNYIQITLTLLEFNINKY